MLICNSSLEIIIGTFGKELDFGGIIIIQDCCIGYKLCMVCRTVLVSLLKVPELALGYCSSIRVVVCIFKSDSEFSIRTKVRGARVLVEVWLKPVSS